MKVRLLATIWAGLALSTQAANATPLAARDINGVQIGMREAQVAAVLKAGLQKVSRDPKVNDYTATSDGAKYLLEFTPLGRLWSVEMFKPLGDFQPDEAFKRQILDKMVAKYGTPSYTKGGVGGATWEDRRPGRPNNPQDGGMIAESIESWVGCCPAKLNITVQSNVIRNEDEASRNAPASRRALDATRF